MKWFVRTLALFMMGMSLLGCLTGCTKKTKSDTTIRVGVLVYKGNDTFISNVYESIADCANDYVGENGERVYLSYSDAQDSQTTQNEQIERYISLDYDVLCVNLVDRTEAASVIDLAREANIPIVFFNREPVREDMQKWDRIVYVGTDARQNAEFEGQIIVDAYNKDNRSIDIDGDGIVRYIMIEGERRHQDTLIRTEASVQYLKDSGFVLEKLDGGIANWIRSQASALAEQYFNEYGDKIELIICNNDDMALGVVDAAIRLGLDFSNIVGIDGTPQGLDAVKKGKMLGTVVIGYEDQARLVFEMALEVLKHDTTNTIEGLSSDKTVRAPLYIVSQHE